MVSQQKIVFVENLYEKLKNKEFGIINVMDVPTSSLQQIRKILEEKRYYLKVIKKSLFIKTLEKLSKENEIYSKIIDKINKQDRITLMLIMPSETINPFVLVKTLEENKSYRYAKVGDIAEEDILVKAGPTDIQAGPALSDFKKLGIPAKVDGGKIVIAEDKVVAKKGDKITPELVSLLQKLNIKPIPVKLKLILYFDGKTIYEEDVLSIPLERYIEDIKNGLRKAFSLSIQIVYPDKSNIRIILSKAYRISRNLSIKLNIPTKENIKDILGNAIRIAENLRRKVNL